MTVQNWRVKSWEELQFVKSDGTVYNLIAPPTRNVLNMEGWGKPPERFHTISGPYQQGDSVISYRLKPRTISLELVNREPSRDEWMYRRSQLLDQMGINNASPNSPVPGVLRWHFIQDNTYKIRALDVFLTRGLVYTPLSDWRSHSLVESLEFTANNPIVYDPTVKTLTINSFTSQLRFNMTYPFVLGTSVGSGNITYVGTWESYPTIIITGPAGGIYIENVTTGKKLRLDYTVSIGETVTITLTYENKTIVNDLGQSLINYLSEDSDLVDFSLQSSNIVSGGINSFYVYLSGPGATTSVVFSYTDKYYGV